MYALLAIFHFHSVSSDVSPCCLICSRCLRSLWIDISIIHRLLMHTYHDRQDVRRWPNVVLMLARRLRRRPSIKTTLGQSLWRGVWLQPPHQKLLITPRKCILLRAHYLIWEGGGRGSVFDADKLFISRWKWQILLYVYIEQLLK